MLESVVLFESDFPIIHVLELSRRDVADGFEETAVVEPVDPSERPELHVVQVPPGSALSDELCLVEADDGLSQGVIVRITPGPH